LLNSIFARASSSDSVVLELNFAQTKHSPGNSLPLLLCNLGPKLRHFAFDCCEAALTRSAGRSTHDGLSLLKVCNAGYLLGLGLERKIKLITLLSESLEESVRAIHSLGREALLVPKALLSHRRLYQVLNV